MEGNNETIKESSQASYSQKSRNQIRFNSRQFVDSQNPRKNITCSANVPNNASGEIEQHQSISSKESTGSARLDQSYEAGQDENNEKFLANNSNRRRGQNAGYRNDKRVGSRGGFSNQDRRYNSSRNSHDNGTTEIRNGRRQFTKGGNSFRSNTRGRGRFHGVQPDCTGEGVGKRNGSVSNSQNAHTSPATTTSENHTVIAAKPNAWIDNTYPITKAFENSALKGLLPGSTEEENEMLERALKLSLEEKQQQRNNYNSHQIERRCSNSSETEVFINEAEEAKKMLRAHDFPPLPITTPNVVPNPAGVTASEIEIEAQHSMIEQHRSENVITNFADGKIEISQSTFEVWDRFGARPKKKVLIPTGRGLGRGRKGSEGKIGELVASSVSSTHSYSITSSVHATPQNMPKPKSPPCVVDFEQFEAAEVSSVILKTDLGFHTTQDDVPSVELMRNASSSSTAWNVQQVSQDATFQLQMLRKTTPQLKAFEKSTQQMKVLDSVTQQDDVVHDLDSVTQQDDVVHDLDSVTQQNDVVHDLDSVTQQEDVVHDLSETTSMRDSAQIPVRMLSIPDVAETENDSAKEGPQNGETPITTTEKSDQSKDEEIRALKEELNRLKHIQDGNHHQTAHFPPPYGVVPLHVPYIVSMPYYRYPFPGMPLPVVRNDSGILDSSFASVPYIPNAQAICTQEVIQMQQTTIPAACDDVVSSASPSNSDIVDMPVLKSSLSPTAEIFHPRQDPPTYVRNDQSYNEVRKPRPKNQNYNRRGNAKNYHGQYQNNSSFRNNSSYNNMSPNFTSMQLPNGRNFQNFQLPMSAPPGNEFISFNYSRGYDHGPSAY